MDRRRFLRLAALAGLGAVATPADLLAQFRVLDPVKVPNPLAAYPSRDWERLYRDIFRHDRTFTFLCAPNDTHNCLLRGFVKNNVLVRIEPTYGYGKATDLAGNRASARWDPRCCQKGLVLGRRLYGDRRVKGAFVRRGFKEWVERGFPRDPETGRAPAELMKRGWDSFVRLPYEEAYALHAKALESIARTYSGDAGRRRLLAQGYDAAMVDALGGAGIRTSKVRGGMAQARRDPHLRHVPVREHAGAARRPRPRRRAGRGARLRLLGLVLLAHRPPARPPDGPRRPDLRLRAVRRGERRAGPRVGHELDHDQDAGQPLAHRGAAQGHPGRRRSPWSTARRRTRATRCW